MPCNMRVKPAELAKEGWSEDQINLLEKEIELARQRAKKVAYDKGYTLETQKEMMEKAEQQARKTAHERMHALLEADMAKIRQFGEAKEIPVEMKMLVQMHEALLAHG